MKRSGLPGGLSRSFAAISTALVVVAASAASAPEGQFEPKTGVALEVLPLQANYYAEPRIQVEFTYRVTKPQDDGKAVVTLLDVDSGEAFTKQFRIPLSFGGHRHWAAWGGDKGPWTSSDDSEIDRTPASKATAPPASSPSTSSIPRRWRSRMSHLGYAVDYATEKRIAEGRLDQMEYDIAVLPAADYIRDETFDRVGAFVARGGKALVVGSPPEHGPMGAARDLGWLRVPKDAAPGVPGCTNSVRFPVGKGEVWTLPAADEPTLRGWIGEIAAATLPPRPVVVDPAFEYRTIPWKTERGEACYVTYIMCNYYQRWTVEDGEEPARAVFSTPVKEAVDLITGETLDPADITIPRGNLRLVRWIPEAGGDEKSRGKKEGETP